MVGNEAWTVGYRARRPLIEHWDGKRWTIVPGAPVKEGILYAVAARSASDVWAVGVRGADEFSGSAIVMHWDGRRWSLVKVPKGARRLNAVTTVGERDVWVAGDSDVLKWNGLGWRRADIPFHGPPGDSVYGIDGTSSKDVWAVGDQGILHWSGRRWRRTRVDPELSVLASGDDFLGTRFAAVAARSAKDAWAVGSAGAVKTDVVWPAIRRWDGRSWRMAVDLFDAARSNGFFYLQSVSTVTATEAWAVGSSGANADGSVPYIMRFACR